MFPDGLALPPSSASLGGFNSVPKTGSTVTVMLPFSFRLRQITQEVVQDLKGDANVDAKVGHCHEARKSRSGTPDMFVA